MIFIHDFIQEIINIQFRSGINNRFHFIQQFIEVNTLGNGNIIQCHFPVNALNNGNFQFWLIGHRTDTKIFRTINFIFLTMFLDQLTEFLSIALCFSSSYARNVLKFFQSYRINSSHRLQWRILENNIGRNIQLLGHFLTQVFQHREQCRVNCTRSATPQRNFFNFFFVKVIILYNLKGFGLLQELMSFGSHLQQAIVLNIFGQVACDQSLTDNSIP